MLKLTLLSLLIMSTTISCGGHYAREAAAWVIGRPLVEIVSCAGIPDQTSAQSDGSLIVQWNTSDQAFTSTTLPLSFVSSLPGVTVPLSALASSIPITMSGGGQCKAIAVVRNGIVKNLRYAGPGDSISGRDALCGTNVFRGCVRNEDTYPKQ